MKPQSLQDAIKANALRKIQKRERGEWKEPVVKKYTMSADEFKAAKQVQTPRSAPPMDYVSFNPQQQQQSSNNGVPDPVLLKKIEIVQADINLCREESKLLRVDYTKVKEELAVMKKEKEETDNINKKLMIDMKQMKEDMLLLKQRIDEVKTMELSPRKSPQKQSSDDSSTIVTTLQTDLKKLRIDLFNMRDDIQSLQKENKNLKLELEQQRQQQQQIQQQQRASSERIVLQEKDQQQQQPPQRSRSKSRPRVVEATTSTSKIETPKSPPKSPKKNPTINKENNKPPASPSSPSKKKKNLCTEDDDKGTTTSNICIEPFTAEQLEFYQKKDEAFQQYVKTKEGLYPIKKMTIADIDKSHIVCFKNRVYIPIKLRTKAMKYYKALYGTNEMNTKLQENCIWPDMENDILTMIE